MFYVGDLSHSGPGLFPILPVGFLYLYTGGIAATFIQSGKLPLPSEILELFSLSESSLG